MENSEVITRIVKRDGTTQHFDSKKITRAITKAAEATGEFDAETAKYSTASAVRVICKNVRTAKTTNTTKATTATNTHHW